MLVFLRLFTLINLYRITVILKVETDIISDISASLIWRAGVFVIMSVKVLGTDVILFIGDVIICFMSDWPINLRMRVTNWPNIKVSSVVQTLSAAHIKGKMSNLLINQMNCLIWAYYHWFHCVAVERFIFMSMTLPWQLLDK
jgi:hypothetical protein